MVVSVGVGVGDGKMVVRRWVNSVVMLEGSRMGLRVVFPSRVRWGGGLGHVAALAGE